MTEYRFSSYGTATASLHHDSYELDAEVQLDVSAFVQSKREMMFGVVPWPEGTKIKTLNPDKGAWVEYASGREFMRNTDKMLVYVDVPSHGPVRLERYDRLHFTSLLQEEIARMSKGIGVSWSLTLESDGRIHGRLDLDRIEVPDQRLIIAEQLKDLGFASEIDFGCLKESVAPYLDGRQIGRGDVVEWDESLAPEWLQGLVGYRPCCTSSLRILVGYRSSVKAAREKLARLLIESPL